MARHSLSPTLARLLNHYLMGLFEPRLTAMKNMDNYDYLKYDRWIVIGIALGILAIICDIIARLLIRLFD